MAFRAKDGKAFANRQQQQAYDERGTANGEPKPKAQTHEEPDGDEAEGGVHEMAETETPIEEHVQEHGPAHKVEVHHDHEGGRHTKISHHGEGAKHVSHHGSAEEAHDAAKLSAGVGTENQPDQEPAVQTGGEGAIPGM